MKEVMIDVRSVYCVKLMKIKKINKDESIIFSTITTNKEKYGLCVKSGPNEFMHIASRETYPVLGKVLNFQAEENMIVVAKDSIKNMGMSLLTLSNKYIKDGKISSKDLIVLENRINERIKLKSETNKNSEDISK